MREWRGALGAQRYEVVLDTQSLVKGALIARFGGGARHGLDAASAREPIAARFYDVVHGVPRVLHAVERNRRLTAAALGYPLLKEFTYGLRARDGGAVDRPAVDRPYAVLLTMTSRADKLWPEASWIELARALGVRVVLPWGSEAEHARAARIAAAVPGAEVPSRRSLTELAALFGSAQHVVGVDTGLTHLAAALGAPTLGLYCGSDPALTGLYGAPRAKNLGAPGRPPAVAEALAALRQ